MPDTLRVVVDRSPVCAGDDTAAHAEVWDFAPTATIDDLLVEMAEGFLPTMACWTVYLNIDDRARRRILGLIYLHDERDGQDRICRFVDRKMTLKELTGSPNLAVYATYRTFDAQRPLTVQEVKASPSFTGTRAVRQIADTRAIAVQQQIVEENDRLTQFAQQRRRDWIRENISCASEPPPGADTFVARSFPHIASLIGPASLQIAETLRVNSNPGRDITHAPVDGNEQAALWTLLQVIAAFEWGMEQYTWRSGKREFAELYLNFLSSCHYSPRAPELVAMGKVPAARFDAKEVWFAMLRNWQYQGRMNRDHGSITDDEYDTAMRTVEAELRQLVEFGVDFQSQAAPQEPSRGTKNKDAKP